MQREGAELPLAALGQEFLRADDEHPPREALDAGRPSPTPAFGLDQVEPAFGAAGEEARADGAVGFDLVMAIARPAGARLEPRKYARQRDLDPPVEGVCAASRGALRPRRVERKADRYAVQSDAPRYRDAGVEVAIDVGDSACVILGPRRRVGKPAAQVGKRANVGRRAGARLIAQGRRKQGSTGAQVVAARKACIAMHYQTPRRHDSETAPDRSSAAWRSKGGIRCNALDPTRNARIDDVDDSPIAGSQLQRGGSAQDSIRAA